MIQIYFIGLLRLEYISLSGNGVISLESSQFKHLHSMRVIFCRYNSLSVIDDDAFYGLQHLEFIDLQGNPPVTTRQKCIQRAKKSNNSFS